MLAHMQANFICRFVRGNTPAGVLTNQRMPSDNPGMNMYKRRRFPPDIISYAVWLYHRFNLSHGDIEDLLAERGITVGYESIRLWCIKFGPRFAKRPRHKHQGFGDTFYIDEVFVKIRGEALPVARCRPGWGCHRCFSPGPKGCKGRQAFLQTADRQAWRRTLDYRYRQAGQFSGCPSGIGSWFTSRYGPIRQQQGREVFAGSGNRTTPVVRLRLRDRR